ncbi:metal-dependent hydrolase [Capnocytophaga sp.]|uniref:metal-dependent hydrolase n=1 Tax=Capnocytophaga sp. TaxID=44737 RepID=UPI0026DB9BA7|nr:metal-dependent hydrolase [Capnocytophaga sp.]MDO5105376.1 metal-dependent hydrolase [Capnocytophaga sp.]
MKVTYLGHACVSIEMEGKHFLVDPFISANPLAKGINIKNIKADYILLTHAHQDHILDAEAIARNTGAKFITNPEIMAHYRALGFDGHEMNIGGSHRFENGKVKVKMIKAEHSSSFPDGKYGGNPAGFLIDNNDLTLYIAGDTALHTDMTIIPHQYKVNLAILPIGNNYTMGVRDALTAAKFVDSYHTLGVHYDTFDVIRIDHEAAKRKFADAHRKLHLLPIGDSIDVASLR